MAADRSHAVENRRISERISGIFATIDTSPVKSDHADDTGYAGRWCPEAFSHHPEALTNIVQTINPLDRPARVVHAGQLVFDAERALAYRRGLEKQHLDTCLWAYYVVPEKFIEGPTGAAAMQAFLRRQAACSALTAGDLPQLCQPDTTVKGVLDILPEVVAAAGPDPVPPDATASLSASAAVCAIALAGWAPTASALNTPGCTALRCVACGRKVLMQAGIPIQWPPVTDLESPGGDAMEGSFDPALDHRPFCPYAGDGWRRCADQVLGSGVCTGGAGVESAAAAGKRFTAADTHPGDALRALRSL